MECPDLVEKPRVRVETENFLPEKLMMEGCCTVMLILHAKLQESFRRSDLLLVFYVYLTGSTGQDRPGGTWQEID